MASPLTIGTTASVVVPVNVKRADIKFQNAGTSTIYLKKIPISGPYSIVSPIDFEFKLSPLAESTEGAESFETNSVASFMAITSSCNSLLAIYETVKV